MKNYIGQNCTLYDRFIVGSFYLLGGISLILIAKDFVSTSLWETILYFLVITFVAMLSIDFLSGVVHFFLDYYDVGPLKPYLLRNIKSIEEIDPAIRKDASILQELAFDFQLHHRFPKSILNASFKAMALRIIYILLPIYLVAFFLYQTHVLHHYVFLFISQVVLIGSFCHYTHQWAHNENPNHFIRILQCCRLIITSKQHVTHHQNYLTNFCSFTGWANFLVNYLFRRFYIHHHQNIHRKNSKSF